MNKKGDADARDKQIRQKSYARTTRRQINEKKTIKKRNQTTKR